MQLGETRERILKAAVKWFSRFGYKKTSLDDIAHEVGLTKGAVYHNFRNKEHLFKEVITREFTLFIHYLRQSLAEADGARNKLRRFVTIRAEYLKQFTLINELSKETYSELATISLDARKEFIAAEVELLAEIMRSGAETGEMRPVPLPVTAEVIYAALGGIDACLVMGERLEKLDEYFAQFADLVIGGVSSTAGHHDGFHDPRLEEKKGTSARI